jgi:hypothetical protein
MAMEPRDSSSSCGLGLRKEEAKGGQKGGQKGGGWGGVVVKEEENICMAVCAESLVRVVR